MDECKKYLFEHRDELDTEKPPRPQVWKYIQRETQVVKPKPVMPLVAKWTAAAAVLVVATVLIIRFQRPEPVNPPAYTVVDAPKASQGPEPKSQADSSTGTASLPASEAPARELPGDQPATETVAATPRREKKEKAVPATKPASPLQAVEDNYATIINYQLEKLEKTPIYTESAGYFHVFKKQWLDLEKEEKKVKQDVKLYGLHDHVVNQLIQLYQQKLWLLKELQTEINRMNVRAQQYPDLRRSNPAYLKL